MAKQVHRCCLTLQFYWPTIKLMSLHYVVSIAIIIFIAPTSEAFSTVSTSGVSSHIVCDTNASTSPNSRTKTVGASDDEERANGVISVPIIEKIAAAFKSSKVTDDQLKKWLSKGKSADIVFYRMKLAKARKWIFRDPEFKRWIRYADDLSATASGKGTSAISTLVAHYGDDDLYNILKAAKESSTREAKAIVSKLQIDQVKRWVRIGKDPDEVYKLYNLNYAGGGLFQDPQFIVWTKYVDDLNVKHKRAISIIPTLRKYYSDADLIRMADAANSVHELKGMGLKVKNSLVSLWINSKQTPATVLADLRLKATAKTLDDPVFSVFVKFTEAYNVQFPRTKTTVLETFTRVFGDHKVAKMMAAVETNDGKLVKIMTDWRAEQLQTWLRSGKSVDEVYRLLKLPNSMLVNDISLNSLFPTWISYMNTFSVEHPDKVTRLLSALANDFNSRPMMQILQAADKFPSMNIVAVKLQLQKAEKVFATGVPPYQAFKILGLDHAGDAVLTSPLFSKWMLYFDDFNKKNRPESLFWSLEGASNIDRFIKTARKTPDGAGIADRVEKAWVKEMSK